LPHWHPLGAALFVTWRLHGSLPANVTAVRFTEADEVLDRAETGPRWLGDPAVAASVAERLTHGERELGLYRMRAWVLMPNHVHVLIFPDAPLSRITKAVKGYSAKRANEILGRTGQPFWEHESYDHWVRTPRELEKIVRYIERNPVKAGLVQCVAEWRWSSAFEPDGTDRE